MKSSAAYLGFNPCLTLHTVSSPKPVCIVLQLYCQVPECKLRFTQEFGSHMSKLAQISHECRSKASRTWKHV